VSYESTIGIFDAPVSCEQPAECERAAGDMPDAIGDVLEADIFSDADVGDVDPVMVPPDATVGTDVAHLAAVRIFSRRQFGGHLTR
jgi:hypothetical protein